MSNLAVLQTLLGRSSGVDVHERRLAAFSLDKTADRIILAKDQGVEEVQDQDNNRSMHDCRPNVDC